MYCRASLHGQGYNREGHLRPTWVALQSFKLVLAAVIPIMALIGAGIVMQRVLEPSPSTPTAAAVTTLVSRVVSSTTTTTEPPPQIRVMRGAGRYETAIAISKAGYPTGAPAVVLSRGDQYQGALCAGPLAKAYGGPVLLVPPEGLTTEVKAELARLKPAEVFLVNVRRGSAMAEELRALPTAPIVTTLNGSDEYETAAMVAEQLKTKLGTISKAVIVPSDTFADGLAAAGLAANFGWPILFTSSGDRPPYDTRTALEDLAVTSVLVVGSQTEVDVATVDRIIADDRYGTSAQLAEYGLERGLNATHVVFAEGEDFPDGLAAGPYAARDGALLLLTRANILPEPIMEVLSGRVGQVSQLDFIALPDLAQAVKLGTAGLTIPGLPAEDTVTPGTTVAPQGTEAAL